MGAVAVVVLGRAHAEQARHAGGVVALDQLVFEVGVTQVDAGVDDRDDRLLGAALDRGDRLGLLGHADGPLLGGLGIVEGALGLGGLGAVGAGQGLEAVRQGDGDVLLDVLDRSAQLLLEVGGGLPGRQLDGVHVQGRNLMGGLRAEALLHAQSLAGAQLDDQLAGGLAGDHRGLVGVHCRAGGREAGLGATRRGGEKEAGGQDQREIPVHGGGLLSAQT
ncbi:hypothetical protein D3C72_960690 [compost metagenome]